MHSFTYRTHLFDIIAVIYCGVPASVGTFERMEIGSAPRCYPDDMVFPIHCIGIHV